VSAPNASTSTRFDRNEPGTAKSQRSDGRLPADDTQVVTKLDRLVRSLPDRRAIVEDLAGRQVKLSLGRSVRDPTDPVGRLLFNCGHGRRVRGGT
jgi:DNA invertase Pin-like site-specific DNA recombinase